MPNYDRTATGWPDVFELHGTPPQVSLVEAALDRFSFPWRILLPGLARRVGRQRIPIEWMDCQVYAAQAAAAEGGESHEDGGVTVHDHAVLPNDQPLEHPHITVGGDTAHPITRIIEGRRRILGLAFYSGRIGLDFSLQDNAELTAEVLGSEGAHMIDFFVMHYQPDLYRAVFNALHPGTDQDAPGPVPEEGAVHHGHGWFDAGSYYSWGGEAFMGPVVSTYSDIPVTIEFVHPPTEEARDVLRNAWPPVTVGTPGGEEPTGPTEPTFWALPGGTIFHEKGKHPATINRARTRNIPLRN